MLWYHFSSRGCHYLHKDKGWCEIDNTTRCGIYQTELGVCIILLNKYKGGGKDKRGKKERYYEIKVIYIVSYLKTLILKMIWK